MRELDFIDWICSQSRPDPSRVPIGPGDDMAEVDFAARRVFVTVDQVLDGVHFDLANHGPGLAGRKAMARSLSDAAAMAVLPRAAVAAVALPKGFSRTRAEDIYSGLREVGDRFDCPLVGGDVASWPGPLTITTTVLAIRADGVEPVPRGGAVVGDAVCVTGRFGGAWRSRRHLEFTPRVEEAIALVRNYRLHAMIDVSDGLAADLANICRASGTGASIEAGAVPIHDDAREHCPEAPLKAALGDGEDYELLFCLPDEQADQLVLRQPLDTPITRIGTIRRGESVTLLMADGSSENLLGLGWQHET